jgi:hypothetical protein
MLNRWTHTLLIAMLCCIGAVPAFAQGEEEVADEGDETSEEVTDAASKGPSLPGSATTATEEDAEISIYRELKTVESQVNDLKEKVFRSKARLLLLEEKVIRGVVSGAKAVIRHVNKLGPAYRLQSITYYFDGNPIFQRTDPTGNGLAKEKELEIFEANVPPGNHTLSVTGVIKGRGTGLFAYLSDYSFNISSSYTFIAEDGTTTRLDAELFKQGGPAGDWVQGPAYEFKLLGGGKASDGVDGDQPAAGAGQ